MFDVNTGRELYGYQLNPLIKTIDPSTNELLINAACFTKSDQNDTALFAVGGSGSVAHEVRIFELSSKKMIGAVT